MASRPPRDLSAASSLRHSTRQQIFVLHQVADRVLARGRVLDVDASNMSLASALGRTRWRRANPSVNTGEQRHAVVHEAPDKPIRRLPERRLNVARDLEQARRRLVMVHGVICDGSGDERMGTKHRFTRNSGADLRVSIVASPRSNASYKRRRCSVASSSCACTSKDRSSTTSSVVCAERRRCENKRLRSRERCAWREVCAVNSAHRTLVDASCLLPTPELVEDACVTKFAW